MIVNLNPSGGHHAREGWANWMDRRCHAACFYRWNPKSSQSIHSTQVSQSQLPNITIWPTHCVCRTRIGCIHTNVFLFTSKNKIHNLKIKQLLSRCDDAGSWGMSNNFVNQVANNQQKSKLPLRDCINIHWVWNLLRVTKNA